MQGCRRSGLRCFPREPSVHPAIAYRSHDDLQRRNPTIHLNASHSTNPKPSWYGESIGHYEGDTLVIDTIGLNNKTFLDNWRTPHTDKLHVMVASLFAAS
jgi:hypothetical protein